MKFLTLFALVLMVASASASLFGGGDVTPSKNPIVDKYHSDEDFVSFYERLIAYVLIGTLGAFFMLLFTFIYYTYRFCRTCLCCCIKSCRVKKTRARSDSLEREILDANPAVSWVLRITVFVLFIVILALVIIGFVASSEVHSNIVETTNTLDKAVSDYNDTVYRVNATFTNLNNKNMSDDLASNMISLMNATNDLADSTHTLNTMGPYVDGIRKNTTTSVYVFVFIPMLIGLVGAIIGKGRLTYIMSLVLPWLVISFWLLFAFHYSMFTINVDVCYQLDDVLTTNYTDSTTNTTGTIISALDCSSITSSASLVNYELNFYIEMTQDALNMTTNQTERAVLLNELYDLQNISSSLSDLEDCSGLTKIMDVAYPDICGKAIEASLFLWRSQIALAVVLLVTCIVGIVSENKIVTHKKKSKEDYSTLALLN